MYVTLTKFLFLTEKHWNTQSNINKNFLYGNMYQSLNIGVMLVRMYVLVFHLSDPYVHNGNVFQLMSWNLVLC